MLDSWNRREVTHNNCEVCGKSQASIKDLLDPHDPTNQLPVNQRVIEAERRGYERGKAAQR